MALAVLRSQSAVFTWPPLRSVIIRYVKRIILVCATNDCNDVFHTSHEHIVLVNFCSGIQNMGFYTGKDVKKDAILNFPEIVVPLLFREWGDHVDGITDGTLW